MDENRTIRMISPDGDVVSIPLNMVHQALQSGGTIADKFVPMIAPDGSMVRIPGSEVGNALSAGGVFSPAGQQGFLERLSNPSAEEQTGFAASLADALQGFRTGVDRTALGIQQFLAPEGSRFSESVRDVMDAQNARNRLAKENSPVSNVLGGIVGSVGSTLPFAAVTPGATGAAAPLVANAGALAPFLQSAIGVIPEVALSSGAQYVNDGETRAGNARNSVLMSLALNSALSGLGATGRWAWNKISPSAKAMAEKASPSLSTRELLERQRAAAGTNTPIGDVIDSGELKKHFENELVPGWLSGGEKKLANIEGQVKGAVSEAFENINPGMADIDISKAERYVKDALLDSLDAADKAKKGLYDHLNNLTRQEGFIVNLGDFPEKIADSAAAINYSVSAQRNPFLKAMLKGNPPGNASQDIVNMLGETGRISSKDVGEVLNSLSLKDAQVLAFNLEEIARSFASSPSGNDRGARKIFSSLAGDLRNIINKQVESKGSEALKAAKKAADENYATQFAPFLDKKVFQFLNPNTSAEGIITKIVQPGKGTDKAELLSQVMSLIPEDAQRVLGQGYLSEAAKTVDGVRTVTPQALMAKINKLGDNQIAALFPSEEVRQQVLDARSLAGMNTEALGRMFNAKTGARGQSARKVATDLGKMAMAGKVAGGLAATASLATGGIRGRHLVNKFTDEGFRDKVVSEILKRQMNQGLAVPAQRNIFSGTLYRSPSIINSAMSDPEEGLQ